MTPDKQRSLITAGASVPPPARSTNPPASIAPQTEEKKRGFPLGAALLVALCGIVWMLWPQIRARVDGLHPAEAPVSAPPVTLDAAADTTAEIDAAPAIDAAVLDADVDAEAVLDGDALADAAALDDASAGDGGLYEEEEEEEEEDAGLRADAAAPAPIPHHTAKPPAKRPPTKPGVKKKRPKRR